MCPFKVYSVVNFGKQITTTNKCLGTFLSSPEETLGPLTVLPIPSCSQPWVLLFLSMDLPIMDVS